MRRGFMEYKLASEMGLKIEDMIRICKSNTDCYECPIARDCQQWKRINKNSLEHLDEVIEWIKKRE